MPDPSVPARAGELDRSFQFDRKGAAFGLLATVQVTLILAITVIAIALPAVQRDLGLRSGQVALVSAGYGLAFSGLLLLGGRVVDLLGSRRVFRAGLTTFGLATVAAGIAPSFLALLVARLAQGTGAAFAAPAAMAMLRSVFPDARQHARAVSMWGGLAPIGATSGIVLSGLAVNWLSWRWAFTIPALVAALAVLASHRLLPEGSPPAPSTLDIPGALLVTTGISMLSYGLVTAGDHGWSSGAARLALIASAVALTGFVAVESRTQRPLVPLSFLRSPRRVIALTAVMVMAAGHASIGFFLALYFQQIRGMSPIAATAAFLPFLIPLLVTGLLVALLAARVPPHAMAATGLFLASAGLLLLAQMGVHTPYVGTTVVGLLVFPVGAALAFSGGTAMAVEAADKSRAGLAGGLVNAAVELGPTVGLAVLVSLAGARRTQLLDAGQGAAEATTAAYGFALTSAAAGLAAAAAGLVLLGRRPKAEAHRSTAQGETP